MAIRIQHYSDVLCVWAYIAQIRVVELQREFGSEVSFDFRYFNVFGDVPGKMDRQWRGRGGLSGYAGHVREVASAFTHAQVHPRVWESAVPRSSMPAHLLLCAARSWAAQQPGGAGAARVQTLDAALRDAFFARAVDIADAQNLLALAAAHDFPAADLEALIRNGTAHAALAADLQLAQEQFVRASPTLIFNEGRQMLTGNVGYRVLEANVRELLRNPAGQQSWC